MKQADRRGKISGNEDYAASYALDLGGNSPELVGEWGAVVAMPNKNQEHEQPISDQFFWYYKGQFTRINVLTKEDGNINVISPAGLTALMTEK